MLELNQLTGAVARMAEALSGQQDERSDLIELARHKLIEHARVTGSLQEKLAIAEKVDPSWRGADPLTEDLSQRSQLPAPPPRATLVASDGSQIYPDSHGIALYYLLNVGTIVLRQGSGQAPETATHCQIFFREQDLFDDARRLIEVDQVNAQRDLWELQALAELAWNERKGPGDHPSPAPGQPVIALADGPLLLWMPQRLTDSQQALHVRAFAGELAALKEARAVPIGYVDRPRSANVLRLLHLAGLPANKIDKEQLRQGNPFRRISDRMLFGDLAPGERTPLFAATSEINETYASQGQRIAFCYLNVAHEPGEREARIVRVEVPAWAAADPTSGVDLDTALAAVWADCRLTGYPYVLTRAHELALVSRRERAALEQMLRVELMRRGLSVAESAKQQGKQAVISRQ